MQVYHPVSPFIRPVSRNIEPLLFAQMRQESHDPLQLIPEPENILFR